eukprot:jgi/Mesen1/5661/ME000286S04873
MMRDSSAMKGVSLEDNQMSLNFERQAFETGSHERTPIPCTLVTGFLGSGKTTLLQHVLRCSGNLRIAVLVNELGEIDVDSMLLNTAQHSAALGLSSVHLASGCACCNIRGQLADAVGAIMRGPHRFDHLIIEACMPSSSSSSTIFAISSLTSGVADPEPVARVLLRLGVTLHSVVTVVDADALPAVLSSPITRRQLALADLILINKCDLVSLGQVADVEDVVEAHTPGSKAVRTRFCRVPLELILDVTPVQLSAPLGATMANTSEGVLSHEAASAGPSAAAAAAAPAGRKVPRHSSVSLGTQTYPDPLAPAVLHKEDGITSLAVRTERPLPLARFQHFVLRHLDAARGLLRAKGLLWFAEHREARYTFQSSGRQRHEAVHSGAWESPPGCHVVLIGRDREELLRLQQALLQLCFAPNSDTPAPSLLPHAAAAAAEAFADLVAHDARFILHCHTAAPNGDEDENEDEDGQRKRSLVLFGLVGAPLKGITEGTLNASLMAHINAHKRLFVTSTPPPSPRHHHSHVLQLAFAAASSGPPPSEAWAHVTTAAAQVLRKSFRDVCPCRCDMTPHMLSAHQ